MNDTAKPERGILKLYVTGFALSIVLTLAAYFAVDEYLLDRWVLVFAISALAIVQAFVQLIFFLHLGKESRPRWNMLVFLFMLLVVAIIVLGSLWIMYNLNDRVMSPMEMDRYMRHQW
jgi:cytochrome o ubiquinol oxidase operon protein cyoD